MLITIQYIPGSRCKVLSGLFYFILFYLFIFLILFIYSTEIETASDRGNRVSGRGRSRLIAEEPDVGLDPIMPGSRPEPKADA